MSRSGAGSRFKFRKCLHCGKMAQFAPSRSYCSRACCFACPRRKKRLQLAAIRRFQSTWERKAMSQRTLHSWIQRKLDHPPKYESSRVQMMRKRYGINEDDFRAILARQGSLCPICGKRLGAGTVGRSSWRKGKPQRRWAIDHDHETAQVRGVLCNVCNSFLGWYERYRDIANRYCACPIICDTVERTGGTP